MLPIDDTRHDMVSTRMQQTHVFVGHLTCACVRVKYVCCVCVCLFRCCAVMCVHVGSNCETDQTTESDRHSTALIHSPHSHTQTLHDDIQTLHHHRHRWARRRCRAYPRSFGSHTRVDLLLRPGPHRTPVGGATIQNTNQHHTIKCSTTGMGAAPSRLTCTILVICVLCTDSFVEFPNGE